MFFLIIYFLDDLYGNEIVFGLGFVSLKNCDVETAEQFILMHKGIFVIFLVISTSPKDLKKMLIL